MIDRQGAQSIGITAEKLAGLQLCPSCRVVLESAIAKTEAPPSAAAPKLDQFGDNLATRRTPTQDRRAPSTSEQMGLGSNVEHPARAALRKRDDAGRRLTFDDAVQTDDSIGVRRDTNAQPVRKAETKLVAAARAFGLKL